MKQVNIYKSIIVLILLIMAPAIKGQDNYTDQISFDNLKVLKASGKTDIAMDINLRDLKISKNEMLVVTPMLISKDREQAIELEPFAVIGRLRNKVLTRPFNYKGKPELNFSQENRIIRKNGSDQLLQYTVSVPFEEWQRQAQLILRSEVIGCADCVDTESDVLLSSKILGDRFIPDYKLSTISSKMEEHSEVFSAHINYIVGQWNLLPNFKDNATELAKVDEVVKEIKSRDNLKITAFTITGYASPEDTKERNYRLSQRRAETFAQYLNKQYGYTPEQYRIEWFGEDWDGLREAVSASSLANKAEIINIIDTEPDYDARDSKLIALDSGVTYRKLLNEFYPPLRRNDYYVSYITHDYDEAEFIRVNSINKAISELRNDNIDEALNSLDKYRDSPDAWNALGVAYARKGDIALATSYFNRAIESDNSDARHNLDQLQKYIEDNQ
jgi:outer membrane protein OmpA-like peptidoglycan-associated protein